MPDVDRLPSGKWQARWRDPDGRQRKKSFRTKALAVQHLAEVETAKATGGYIEVNDRTTVAQYAHAWAAARPYRETSRTRVTSDIRNHIEGTHLGGMRIGRVRPSDVQAWATDRAQVLGPTTVRLLVGLLRSIFASAVLDRLIASSPVVRVTLPRHEAARVVPLTVPQVRALAAKMPPRYKAMVITQAGLGLRLCELLALRVEDVDFLRRSVHIRSQFPSGRRVRTTTKTPRSERQVPLPTIVAEALAEHMKAFPASDDGTIFLNHGGRVWRSESYGTRIFRRVVEVAGLPEGTTSHDLRHHYASVLLAAGESVVAVAERLGHSDAALVLRVFMAPDARQRGSHPQGR